MTTKLAAHFKAERLRRKLSLGELSRIIGYADTGKGAGRIRKFEETGAVHRELLAKLCAALGVERTMAEALIEQDCRRFFSDWNAWANEPIKPYLVVRMIPAFYISEEVPQEVVTLNEAEAFAAARANHWKRKCCLVVSRRHSIWFDENGEVYDRTEAVPGEPNVPHMRLGRSRKSFLVRSLSPQEFLRSVEWPQNLGPVQKTEEDKWD